MVCLQSTYLQSKRIPSWELTYPPFKGTFEDDVPFCKVRYVSSLEDNSPSPHFAWLKSKKHLCICRSAYMEAHPMSKWLHCNSPVERKKKPLVASQHRQTNKKTQKTHILPAIPWEEPNVFFLICPNKNSFQSWIPGKIAGAPWKKGAPPKDSRPYTPQVPLLKGSFSERVFKQRGLGPSQGYHQPIKTWIW